MKCRGSVGPGAHVRSQIDIPGVVIRAWSGAPCCEPTHARCGVSNQWSEEERVDTATVVTKDGSGCGAHEFCACTRFGYSRTHSTLRCRLGIDQFAGRTGFL